MEGGGACCVFCIVYEGMQSAVLGWSKGKEEQMLSLRLIRASSTYLFNHGCEADFSLPWFCGRLPNLVLAP